MEVKVLGPDFEKMIIKPGVYIIELEFLGKKQSCTLITDKVTRNRYGHRIKILLDEKNMLLNYSFFGKDLQYTDLEHITINGRAYYLADYKMEACSDLINLTYVCLDTIKHIRKKGE